ncbi:hypothetical protein PIB30_050551 [Stylosanthes scabra]|uniref:Uncharacterized protein n=1 Tax=Stylosanthes scabra TaxID=79078 RepID=A0ABU6ZGH6_9FABA|nr:hypothetical protein [Stylosanthes scabra]
MNDFKKCMKMALALSVSGGLECARLRLGALSSTPRCGALSRIAPKLRFLLLKLPFSIFPEEDVVVGNRESEVQSAKAPALVDQLRRKCFDGCPAAALATGSEFLDFQNTEYRCRGIQTNCEIDSGVSSTRKVSQSLQPIKNTEY